MLATICLAAPREGTADDFSNASDPANTSYQIDGEWVRLKNGLAEEPAAPGSASRITTQIVGDPVIGDLDGDGDEDAVVWLLQQTGGTGSFFYVGAALRTSGGFQGTTTVFVGDRIEPRTLSIMHRLVSAQYRDRGIDAPMAASPNKDAKLYLTALPAGLSAVERASHKTPVLHGWLVVDHAVMTFTPCGTDNPLRLSGDRDVITTLVQQFHTAHAGLEPYARLFVTLVGSPADVPETSTLAVTGLVQVWPAGNCMSERIVVEEPLPGSIADAPLVVRGHAKGAWFFEGEIGLKLVDPDRNVIARGFATAKGEWMKMGFVPFEGHLKFQRPAGTERAYLIVSRNNPSENRSLDEALEVPVMFR